MSDNEEYKRKPVRRASSIVREMVGLASMLKEATLQMDHDDDESDIQAGAEANLRRRQAQDPPASRSDEDDNNNNDSDSNRRLFFGRETSQRTMGILRAAMGNFRMPSGRSLHSDDEDDQQQHLASFTEQSSESEDMRITALKTRRNARRNNDNNDNNNNSSSRTVAPFLRSTSREVFRSAMGVLRVNSRKEEIEEEDAGDLLLDSSRQQSNSESSDTGDAEPQKTVSFAPEHTEMGGGGGMAGRSERRRAARKKRELYMDESTHSAATDATSTITTDKEINLAKVRRAKLLCCVFIVLAVAIIVGANFGARALAGKDDDDENGEDTGLLRGTAAPNQSVAPTDTFGNSWTFAPTNAPVTIPSSDAPTTDAPSRSPAPSLARTPTYCPSMLPTNSLPSATTAVPTTSSAPTHAPTVFAPTTAPTSSAAPTISAAPTGAPSSAPTLNPTNTYHGALEDAPRFTIVAMDDPVSPQSRADAWLRENYSEEFLAEMPEWRKEQLFALGSFYYAFNGDTWSQEDRIMWMNASVPECEGWKPHPEPNCSPEGYLTALRISYFRGFDGIPGSIPAEIEFLSHLETLEIHKIRLQGEVQNVLPIDHLKLLSSLKELAVTGNEAFLHGTIPSEIGELKDIDHLYLFGNSIEGQIPSEVGSIDTLQELDLSFNKLTGSIPTAIGQLSGLKRLILSGNSMTGSIPTELGLATDLEELWLIFNSLTGTIPTELAFLPNLNTLQLYGNKFHGTLDPMFCALQRGRLQSIGLHGSSVLCPPECDCNT